MRGIIKEKNLKKIGNFIKYKFSATANFRRLSYIVLKKEILAGPLGPQKPEKSSTSESPKRPNRQYRPDSPIGREIEEVSRKPKNQTGPEGPSRPGSPTRPDRLTRPKAPVGPEKPAPAHPGDTFMAEKNDQRPPENNLLKFFSKILQK